MTAGKHSTAATPGMQSSASSPSAFLPESRHVPPKAIMTMPRTFTKEEVRIAEHFALELATTVKHRIASVALDRTPLAGRELAKAHHQIPLIVFIDDLSKPLTDQDIRSYVSVVSRLVHTISKRLHVSTLKLSEHWERFRLAVPQHLDMLRYGVAVYDKGFFEPPRYLITKGRIRPSLESEGLFITRADATLKSANAHMLHATLDLYWAGIDACHAGLMKAGHIPSEPSDIPRHMQDELVSKGLLEKDYPPIMQMLYDVSRGILHKTIPSVSGQDYDHYFREAKRLVARMEQVVRNL